MQRDNVVKEVQKRIYQITTGNGYDFSVNKVERNPEEQPDPDSMPLVQIFEFPEITLTNSTRGGMPIQTKELQLVVEFFYKSASQGATTPDIIKFLRYIRKTIFQDGIALGGVAKEIVETEVSRVLRPPLGNRIVGMGEVLAIKYVEDFNLM